MKIKETPSIPEEASVPGMNREGVPDYLRVFQEVSGSTDDEVLYFRALIDAIPKLSDDVIEAAKAVRMHLINEGFNYDEKAFAMQEMLDKKGGNCLGLTLLFGIILFEKGFSPEFKMLIHPDTAEKPDHIAFQHFYDWVDYNNPELPKRSDEMKHGINHFIPLEHPIMFLDGKPFETTLIGKDCVDEDPIFLAGAESTRDLTFQELLSCVYVERAHWIARHSDHREEHPENLGPMKDLISKGLSLWEGNREGWFTLWAIASDMADKKLIAETFSKYVEIGGEDSRYFYNLYHMTKDVKYLDQALEKYPEHILAFLEKHVVLEKNDADAKANFAVVAWCITRSAYLSLDNLYQNSKILERVRGLFGEKELKKMT